MQPVGVVEANDVMVDVIDGLGWIGITSLPYPLHLQGQEKSFHHRIDAPMSTAVAFAAHAGNQAVPGKQIAVSLAGILATTVGMHDQAWFGLA